MTRLVDALRWVIRGSRLLHRDPDNLRRITNDVGSYQNGPKRLPSSRGLTQLICLSRADSGPGFGSTGELA
jgi:hypothetical protein